MDCWSTSISHADETSVPVVKGRFAPSPTGRMHLGNVYAALMSMLSAKSRGGKWLLRIEDLDPGRSRYEYARQIEDDLHRLGLEWDEGGLDDRGDAGPYSQSRREAFYVSALERLSRLGLVYPCTCRRADLLASQAPHQSDGCVVYSGRCRPATLPDNNIVLPGNVAIRLAVPDRYISFDDEIRLKQEVNLARDCGDFIVRRSDGCFAYQLAVVVDDELMGVTEVVRGDDLLLSTARQIYLQELLGYRRLSYCHLPLICNSDGQRLSKRDRSMALDSLFERHSPREIIGIVASMAGLIDKPEPCSPTELIPLYDPIKIRNKSLFHNKY